MAEERTRGMEGNRWLLRVRLGLTNLEKERGSYILLLKAFRLCKLKIGERGSGFLVWLELMVDLVKSYS